MEPWVFALVLMAATVSFMVSASAGLGGSLILVPTLALILGTKEGVALAALLLAANNVVKVFAYRETLPFRKALAVVVLVALGAALGAGLLVAAPEEVVTVAVIVSFVTALVAERLDLSGLRRLGAPLLAFGS
ncbi:MAG: sulfite exporter TauE/SafE family protein, partial [Actinobacteria bacterium]|nr:sulfite exporter TauE/SafE family protein [Actinomycetota bacterium]